MKAVFLGTGEFAVPSLEALAEAGHEISLVVSQPDRPQGRGLSLRETPVKRAALARGLPVFQPEKLRLEPERVINERADVLVVVAYGQILRENILQCAPRGAVNVHASLLPRYRGAAPIQWALASGETRTGITTMQLDRGMDTGPILLQERVDIAPDETAEHLEPRLATLGAALLLRTLKGLESGEVKPLPQEHARATLAPIIRKSDGDVDFNRSAADIVNRIRGFAPWPGVRFSHAGKMVRISAASVAPPAGVEGPGKPGEILAIARPALDVRCADGSVLRLQRVQPESRGVMNASDFANGAKLEPGSVIGLGELK